MNTEPATQYTISDEELFALIDQSKRQYERYIEITSLCRMPNPYNQPIEAAPNWSSPLTLTIQDTTRNAILE
jgi:hypothetical protein